MIQFTVYGEPQGKGRPRFVARYNPATQKSFGQAHTPEKTIVYENLIRTEYSLQTKNFRYPDDAMLDMRIMAYYGVPKNVSKKKRALMLEGKIRPTKKPDMDNVMKVVADSLNQVAYKDDTQIVDAQCRKFYSVKPRIEVIIKQID
ncbi:MAG: RusA family crossover junction endodeoxyribonuclease [Lachnospiraceae bacterium]